MPSLNSYLSIRFLIQFILNFFPLFDELNCYCWQLPLYFHFAIQKVKPKFAIKIFQSKRHQSLNYFLKFFLFEFLSSSIINLCFMRIIIMLESGRKQMKSEKWNSKTVITRHGLYDNNFKVLGDRKLAMIVFALL